MSKLNFKKGVIGDVVLKGSALWVSKHDPYCLYDHCDGMENYIEIGTGFGYSSIVAALGVKGEVHCIDMGWKASWQRKWGFWQDVVTENWRRCGLDTSRLFMYTHKTPPLPEEVQDMQFDVSLVDGAHGPFEHVLEDFSILAAVTKKYVLMHDVNENRPYENERPVEVMHWVDKHHPDWEIAEIRGAMGVLARVNR